MRAAHPHQKFQRVPPPPGGCPLGQKSVLCRKMVNVDRGPPVDLARPAFQLLHCICQFNRMNQ